MNVPQSQSSGSSPLLMYQPYNIAVLLTFYSPIIIAISVLSMSFVSQNFKGIIYLVYLLLFSWLRSLGLEISGSTKMDARPGDICTMVQYSQYGNSSFSMFFIAFSLVYICAPMFFNQQINYWIFSGLLFYYLLDLGVRFYSGCVQKTSEVLLHTVIGLASGIISVMVMYGTNTQKYLFFNETSSTKDVCTMPSKQTFKCSVYKNGELVGTV